MRAKIREVLTTFAAPRAAFDEARRRRLLDFILAAMVIGAVLGLLFVLGAPAIGYTRGPAELQNILVGAGGGLVGTAVIFVLSRRVSTDLAALILVVLLLALVLISDEPARVANGRGLLFFALPIVIAAVLGRPWAGFVVAGVSSLALIGLSFDPAAGPPNVYAMVGFFVLAGLAGYATATQEQMLRELAAANGAQAILNRELILLNRVAELANRPTAPAALLQQILDALMPVLGFDVGWIVLPGPTLDDRPTIAAHFGVSPQFVAAEAAEPLAACPACCYVLAHDDIAGPLMTAQCPRLDPAVIAAEGPLHHIGVPLQTNERILGILNVGFRRPAPYEERQRALLTAVGRQVGLALDNAHLYQALHDHAAALEETVAQRTAELQQANARLQELDRLKREFIAQASHELRTPLANIKTSVYLLERGHPEKRDQYVATLDREADMLHRLVEDLLALTTLDLGQLRPVKQPVAVGLLIEQLAAEQADLLAGRGLTLRVLRAADLPQIQADSRLLTQALVNLIINATERAPHGREIVVACDRQSAEGDWVTIAVHEPVVVIASVAGAGLRQAICEEIARRHGGRLTGDERSVTLWLPVEGDGVMG